MNLIPRAFLLAILLCGMPGLAWCAGSADIGRSYFQPGVAPGQGLCLQCHFDPPTAPRYAGARFNPAFLSAAFQRVGAMNGNPDLLGPSGIADVATYLGLVGQGRPNATDVDRLLDWGEDTYTDMLLPRRRPTEQALGYSYRHYPATGIYVGIKDGSVYFLDTRNPVGEIVNLGSVRSFLDQMPDDL